MPCTEVPTVVAPAPAGGSGHALADRPTLRPTRDNQPSAAGPPPPAVDPGRAPPPLGRGTAAACAGCAPVRAGGAREPRPEWRPRSVWRTGHRSGPPPRHARLRRARRVLGSALTVILLVVAGVAVWLRFFHHAPFQ